MPNDRQEEEGHARNLAGLGGTMAVAACAAAWTCAAAQVQAAASSVDQAGAVAAQRSVTGIVVTASRSAGCGGALFIGYDLDVRYQS
jgi:hypothetical protein